MNRLLIVEDDADVADALQRTLAGLGCTLTHAASFADAQAALRRAVYEVAVLDLGLPDCVGLAGLDALLAQDAGCKVIVVSGRNDAALAVGALQRGAADYLVKPWDRAVLVRVVGRALEEVRLRREMEAARVQLQREAPRAVGGSAVWQRTLADVRAAAENARAPVLIGGESGTGKDVVAGLVHQWSPRAAGPFVTLNAACLPASLIESELFGHEAGAFSGARVARRGLFEIASGGTLFLDEIGELPVELQPKLLRALEGQPFRRLGGEREVKADVRLVAATNRSLPEMLRQGRFREDLYYRLSVLELHLPPLRARRDDVRELTLHFVSRLARDAGRAEASIDPRALACLARYAWPGNVRELRNVVERALVLARGGAIGVEHLPEGIRSGTDPPRDAPERGPGARDARTESGTFELWRPAPGDDTLVGAVRSHVLAVYARHAGNLSRTAAALGITRVALRRKLREFGAYDPAATPARRRADSA